MDTVPIYWLLITACAFFLIGMLVAHIEQKTRHKQECDEHEEHFQKDYAQSIFHKHQAD